LRTRHASSLNACTVACRYEEDHDDEDSEVEDSETVAHARAVARLVKDDARPVTVVWHMHIWCSFAFPAILLYMQSDELKEYNLDEYDNEDCMLGKLFCFTATKNCVRVHDSTSRAWRWVGWIVALCRQRG
jgi:hypothetical protein